MKKGLIIGNSHVAMLAKSWRIKATDFANMKLEFFAQPGDGPKGIAFKNSTMYAADPELQKFLVSSGAKKNVNLNDFDFLVIVACGLSIYHAVSVALNYHVWAWPSSHQAIAQEIPFGDVQLVSAGCLHSTLLNALENTLGASLTKTLRSITSIPIFIITQPLPSEKLSKMKNKGHNFHKTVQYGTNEQIYQAFQAAITDVFSSVPQSTVIFQPCETIQSNIYTRQKFTTGAVRLYNLDKKQNSTDTLHANERYGALILTKLYENITNLSKISK